MIRSFHVDIEIDESKLDEDTKAWINEDLNRQWLEKIVENELENENVPADVFAQAD